MLENKNFRIRRYSKHEIFIHRITVAAISIIALLLIALIVIFASKFFKNKTLSKPSDVQVENKSIEEVKTPPKDTDIIPGSNICYGGEKSAVSAEDVEKIVNGKNIDDKKYIFLTFDDGPSPNTEKILNILKEKDVKATFFVLGQNIQKDDSLKPILQRCITDGNALGNHTYSHETKTIYPGNSVNSDIYLDEFNKTNDLLKGILGSDFDTRITRMPGGHNTRVYYHDKNLPTFDEELKKNNITCIDWTTMNGDADPHCKGFSPEQLLNEAEKESQGQNQIVILMHDTYGKEKTVQMLPALIDYYRTNGYEFKTIRSTFNKTNNNTDTNNQ